MSTAIRHPVIDPHQSYTFSDYFKLNPPVDELVRYFGYQHRNEHYQLPQTAIDEAFFAPLHKELNEILLYVDLTSEIARREVLIAPVLLNVTRYLKIKIRIEYFLDVTNQLRGTLDYLLQNSDNLLVVEAKDENLQRGFTQLATELIALDQWEERATPLLYGAVSIGNVWQFGILERATKVIIQDVNLYRVPTDLQTLLKILTAILA
ncbi:MAG: hypothetical protein R3C14_37895 [Caldilineaceae bacterium]